MQSYTLLLADMFESFREKCIEQMYMSLILHTNLAQRSEWKACLKEKKAKLELLTDVDMLRMVKKDIRGGMFHAIHRYTKTNNK